MPVLPSSNGARSQSFIRSVVKGCSAASIFVILATILFAFVTTIVEVAETTCLNVQAGVGMVGVFLGGVIAGRASANRGWLVGLVVGIVFAVIYFIASGESSIGAQRFFAAGRQMLTITAAGLLGGILGVNL